MSITPVATTGLESLTTDAGSDAPASGFDLLLASAAAPAPKPETSRADNERDSEPDTAADRSTDKANAKTSTDKTGADKSADKSDDATGLLAALAPTVSTPTPTPAPPSGVPDTTAPPSETPAVPVTTPIPVPPVVVTAPPADLIDPTATDPGATGSGSAPTDPALALAAPVDLQGVLEAALDNAGPETPVAATAAPGAELTDLITGEATPSTPRGAAPVAAPPTPPRAAAPRAENAPAPNAPADGSSAAAKSDPAPAANANTATTNGAVADAPVVAAADHIRLTTVSTPVRTEGPTTNALEATAPAPPAPAPTANAAVVDTVTTTSAAAPPPPAEQLVSVLKPMRETPNGSYTLHLELKPPELGRIELRVEMRDGVMHASIHSDREGSAQMLRDALSDLRDRLDAASVRTGSLTVSDGSVGARDHGGANANAHSGPNLGDDLANANEPTTAPNIPAADLESEATSLLDVRV